MIDLSQDGISADRVLRALHFPRGHRRTSFALYAVREGVPFRRLRLLESEIACESGADVKYSARFTVLGDADVDWRRDGLRLEMQVLVDGKTLCYPFPLLRAVRVSDAPSGAGRVILEAKDETILLKRSCVGDGLFLPAGTRYVPYIEETLAKAGFQNTFIEACDAATAYDREDWGPETSLLLFLNELLAEIGYRSLEPTAGGLLRAARFSSVSKENAIGYQSGKEGVVIAGTRRSQDYACRPNRFIGYVSNPDAGPLRYEWSNTDPASPTSPQRNGGRIITAVRKYGHIADEESLQTAVLRWGAEVEQEVETVLLRTPPMPHHEVGEAVLLDCAACSGLFYEAGWRIADGVMTHELRRCSFD